MKKLKEQFEKDGKTYILIKTYASKAYKVILHDKPTVNMAVIYNEQNVPDWCYEENQPN